jgi:hypothetical protein
MDFLLRTTQPRLNMPGNLFFVTMWSFGSAFV